MKNDPAAALGSTRSPLGQGVIAPAGNSLAVDAYPTSGSSTRAAPTLEPTTPRSLHNYDLNPSLAGLSEVQGASRGTNNFFADWEQSPHLKLQHSPGTQDIHDEERHAFADGDGSPPGPRYRLDSLSTDSSTTPLHASVSASASAASTPLFPPLFMEGSIQSPVPASTTIPPAPRLSTISTPVFTPSPTPALGLFHNLPSPSPIPAGARTLLARGSLPLPGEPDEVTEEVEHAQTGTFSRFLSHPSRSDSQNSISSITNECGHLSAVDHHTAGYDNQPYERQSEAHDINNTPQRILQKLSDPPLIPHAKPLPQLHNVLTSDTQVFDRPISPFSPTQALYSHTLPSSLGLVNPGLDSDLINFDSDAESSFEAYRPSQYPPQDSYSLAAENAYADEDAGLSSDEEEDLDDNLLYSTLSHNGSPYVRKAWESGKVILVPPRHLLPPAFLSANRSLYDDAVDEDVRNTKDWEKYSALHALRQHAGSPDVFVGCSKTFDGQTLFAKLDSSSREIEISLRNEDDEDWQPAMAKSGRAAPLVRTDTVTTTSSFSAAHAVAPHLTISSSPTSTAESSNYPITPPISPPFRPTSSYCSQPSRKLEPIAFPTMEPLIPLPKDEPAQPYRLKILGETPVYRRRRESHSFQPSLPGGAASCPTSMPHWNASSSSILSQDLSKRLSTMSVAEASPHLPQKSVKKRDSKVRLRVPRWFRAGSKENLRATAESAAAAANAAVTASALAAQQSQQPARPKVSQEESQAVIEKLRVIRVDGLILAWPGDEGMQLSTQMQQALPSSPEHALVTSQASSAAPSRQISSASRYSRRSSNMLRHRYSSTSSMSHHPAGPGLRDFSSDIATMLDPPAHLAYLAEDLQIALREIIRLTRNLAESVTHVQGCEDAIVQHLRRDVLDFVWERFEQEDLSTLQRDMLFESFENVIMSFMHSKLYDTCLKSSYRAQDDSVNRIVRLYRSSGVVISDFTISTSTTEASFSSTIETLSALSGFDNVRQELWEKMSPPTYKRLVQLISETTDSASTVIALLEAKTPLDCALVLRKAIDDVVRATERGAAVESRNSLATDDLIALLAWCIVRANMQNLDSTIHYTRAFKLSGPLSADVEWALVQFEAALAYLRTDPLRLTRVEETPLPSPALSNYSEPTMLEYERRSSSDSLAPPAIRSRRASVQSLSAASSARPRSRSPLRSHGHQRAMSSMPIIRSTGMPTSSTLAEDNVEMGPPRPPGSSSERRSEDGAASRMEARRSSAHNMSSPEVQYRQGTGRGIPTRPAPRSFHFSQIDEPTSMPTRIPLGRSQTNPALAAFRTASAAKTSADLHRTGSENSRRASVDWWGPLRQRVVAPASPHLGSDISTTSGPDSPGKPHSERSSFDLDRSTSDIGWLEWGRKRLSSMTSATSMQADAENNVSVRKTIAEQVAEKIAASNDQPAGPLTTRARPRRNSESAAVMISSSAPVQAFDDTVSDVNSEASSSHIAAVTTGQSYYSASMEARSLSHSSRPRSTLSLSSMSSADTDHSAAHTRLPSHSGLPRSSTQSTFRHSISGSSNLARSRRFRKELLSANIAPPQLHLDPAITSFPSRASAGSHVFPSSPGGATSPGAASEGSSHLNVGASYAYPSYSLVHSSSRFGSTPFSPIQEVSSFSTPSPDSTKSPRLELQHHRQSSTPSLHVEGTETPAPPTPRELTAFPKDCLLPAQTSTSTPTSFTSTSPCNYVQHI